MKVAELEVIKISAAECLADSKTPFERDMFRTQLSLANEVERLRRALKDLSLKVVHASHKEFIESTLESK